MRIRHRWKAMRQGAGLRRLIGGVAALTVVAVGVFSAGTASASTSSGIDTSTVAWGECTRSILRAFGAQCGFVTVPLDYAHPEGATVQIAVSRILHTTPDDQFQGPLLVNPGGPGGSGLILSVLGAFVPNGGANAYDIIGFDPRGVGASRPALSCQPDFNVGPKPDYIPSAPALVQTWLDRARAYATACGANGGALLEHLSTVDTVRDMDSIRDALGQQKISFYGFSYGTYLGQVYATLYPQRVHRMVLDSNIDPRAVWYQANLNQDVAFDRNINIFFDWVARFDSVYHLGKSEAVVRQLYYREQTALGANPAGGVVGPDEFNDIFLLAAYSQFNWPALGDVLARWVNDRDSGPLLQWYQIADDPGHDGGHAIYSAVECTDAQWPTNPAKYLTDNWAVYRTAPFVTWGNAWFNAPCLFWPAAAHTPVNVDGRGVNPILLIDETLDAATPFEGSLEVRRRFPNASLIAEPGGTNHASSLSGNACVDDQIAAYLASGTLPARQSGDSPDALCDPLPEPVPAAQATQAVAPSSVLANRLPLPVTIR